MNGLSVWVLSIVGIAFTGVFVDIIMPEGKMNKYVKGVFALVSLLVIISPVAKIIDEGFTIKDVFYNENATMIDKDFVDATNKQIKESLENSLEAKLANAGFMQVDVEIKVNLDNQDFEIEKIIVDISKMVINSNMVHINKYTEIKGVVINYINVEESDVIINE